MRQLIYEIALFDDSLYNSPVYAAVDGIVHAKFYDGVGAIINHIYNVTCIKMHLQCDPTMQ